MQKLVSTLFLATAVSLTAGCQTIRDLELKTTYQTIAPAEETKLGNTYAEQVRKETPLLGDAELDAYVQRMGDALVANSPECEQTFKFLVTKDESVNAFAIPGGHCYINVGLFKFADNEAQLAAVVGHEINHVTRRHGVRSLQRQMGLEQASTLVSGAETSQIVSTVQQAGGVVAMRSFGRDDEREADKYGVEAMYKSGYDPAEAATFFAKLKRYTDGASAGFLDRLMSSHPATQERIDNITAQVKELDMSKPLKKTSPEFEAMKARVIKLTGAGVS